MALFSLPWCLPPALNSPSHPLSLHQDSHPSPNPALPSGTLRASPLGASPGSSGMPRRRPSAAPLLALGPCNLQPAGSFCCSFRLSAAPQPWLSSLGTPARGCYTPAFQPSPGTALPYRASLLSSHSQASDSFPDAALPSSLAQQGAWPGPGELSPISFSGPATLPQGIMSSNFSLQPSGPETFIFLK